ncbi:MAG: amidohydrolase [Gammaproteobacteria bacterium]|nr:amidohydrolase [Gammaproteobacteria bacterium]
MRITNPRSILRVLLPLALSGPVFALEGVPIESIDSLSQELSGQVVAWRRDFHQHPELSNREFRTAALVAEHLEALGMEVETGVAHTGVVGTLTGGKPGPVVLLRADMDGLPVQERNDLPFRSEARAEYNGEDVPVMHACGHDAHVAILMGAAQILSDLRDELPGTVKFVFQPAEEGAPRGEGGGAELMVTEGVLKNPDVNAAFALHINASQEAGRIGYASGPRYASVDDFKITVRGVQAHGAAPWMGIDTVVVSAQIINALQTIVSRNLELTEQAGIVTVGSIHGGVRSNIIPEEVEMVGTIRALDTGMRDLIHRRVREIAEGVATSMGATAEVVIPWSTSYPITYNDPGLTTEMLPVLEAVAGRDRVERLKPITGAEDFSYFANEVPGFYISLGGKPPGKPLSEVAAHHTPDFFVDESGLDVGVRAMAAMAWRYLSQHSNQTVP